ncbi:MAG: hypothetical protein ACRETK_05700 [Steroidobacteraceae bacterium]
MMAGAVGLAVQAAAWAGAPSGPQGQTWASIAKLPNWQGIWQAHFGRPLQGGAPTGPVLTAKAKANLDAFRAKQKFGEDLQPQTANCVPPGMPTIMTQPYPIEFLFNPGKVVILIEAYEQERTIFTDGRKHPSASTLTQTFQGNSIGHWEGDTLVVDTVGVLPDTGAGIEPGIPHDASMHIIERIRKADKDHILIERTIIDPVVFAKPWTTTLTYTRVDGDIMEYICDQGNRDSADSEGRPGERIGGP